LLVKINSIDESENMVCVTKLDIDDYGSIMPVNELELRLPTDDDSILEILKNSSHAAIFTENDIDNDNATIISASGMSNDDLNREKQKIIDTMRNKK
jgi:hypothetical protein